VPSSRRGWTRGQRRILAMSAIALAACLVGVLGYEVEVSVRPARAASPTAENQVQTGFVRIDRAAPAVNLPSLVGHGSVRLAKLAGKPIVINFWSSTCAICAQETRALVQVARSTRGRVSFLGIDTLDMRASATAFADRYRIPYRIGYDPTEAVGARYDLPGLPVTFFLSTSGKRILGINIGALTARSLTAILHKLYGHL